MIGLIFGETYFPKEILRKVKKRKSYKNKKIMQLNEAYEKIFSSQNLHENLSKINGEYKDNELVQEVTNFISKDKKRPICSPLKI